MSCFKESGVWKIPKIKDYTSPDFLADDEETLEFPSPGRLLCTEFWFGIDKIASQFSSFLDVAIAIVYRYIEMYRYMFKKA